MIKSKAPMSKNVNMSGVMILLKRLLLYQLIVLDFISKLIIRNHTLTMKINQLRKGFEDLSQQNF